MTSIVLEEAQTARGRKRTDNELLGIANDTKDALLSAIGHDLWPPLSVIAGFAETLRRDGEKMSKADREAVKRIADNAERIEEVLRRLLSVSEDLRVMGKPGWNKLIRVDYHRSKQVPRNLLRYPQSGRHQEALGAAHA